METLFFEEIAVIETWFLASLPAQMLRYLPTNFNFSGVLLPLQSSLRNPKNLMPIVALVFMVSLLWLTGIGSSQTLGNFAEPGNHRALIPKLNFSLIF